jgi:2-oxoglutarate ferredoxin oxidoreductase, gamma subunit (EC 1.2.7.3)
VTYIPVYGPEMRGGTANCTSCLRRRHRFAHHPLAGEPDHHERPVPGQIPAQLQDGGILILNSSLIDPVKTDKDRVKVYAVPVNEIADGLGNTRMANMVAIGAYVRRPASCRSSRCRTAWARSSPNTTVT